MNKHLTMIMQTPKKDENNRITHCELSRNSWVMHTLLLYVLCYLSDLVI